MNQEKKAERLSNIELCRLFCMFYIVVYHLFIHNLDVTGDVYYRRALTTIFSIGVPVFVIISGYFRIKASAKGVLSLVAQVVFYSLFTDLLCKFVFHEPLTKGDILSTFLPISKSSYWFVGTYLFLYIISPFLNKFLDSITKGQKFYYFITLTILVCYCGGCIDQHGPNYGDRSIITFIYLYSIGSFIKECDFEIGEHFMIIKKHPWVLYGLSSLVFFGFVSFLPSLFSRGINFFFHAYNTIGLIFFSILFFYCFKSLNVQNKWINLMAKSTFAIYLIHGNSIVTYHRWIYDPYTQIGVGIGNIHLRFLYLIVSAVVICVACILVDQLRQILFKYAGIDWVINRIDTYVKRKSLNFNGLK